MTSKSNKLIRPESIACTNLERSHMHEVPEDHIIDGEK